MKKSRFVAFAALLMALLLLVCSCGNSASTTPEASSTQVGQLGNRNGAHRFCEQ